MTPALMTPIRWFDGPTIWVTQWPSDPVWVWGLVLSRDTPQDFLGA